VSNKRKKIARAVMAETGMSYQAALNAMNSGRVEVDHATGKIRLKTMKELVDARLGSFVRPGPAADSER